MSSDPQNLSFSYLYTQNMRSLYYMFNMSCCLYVRRVYCLCKMVHRRISSELFQIKNLSCSTTQIKYTKPAQYLLTAWLRAGLLLWARRVSLSGLRAVCAQVRWAPLAHSRAPTAHSLPARWAEKTAREKSRVKMKTWRSLISYYCKQNRLNLGRINLIYCQLKYIWVVRNKKTNTKTLFLPHSPAQLSSFTSSSSSPVPSRTDGWRVICHFPSATHFPFLTLLPCSSLGSPQATAPLRMSFCSMARLLSGLCSVHREPPPPSLTLVLSLVCPL